MDSDWYQDAFRDGAEYVGETLDADVYVRSLEVRVGLGEPMGVIVEYVIMPRETGT